MPNASVSVKTELKHHKNTSREMKDIFTIERNMWIWWFRAMWMKDWAKPKEMHTHRTSTGGQPISGNVDSVPEFGTTWPTSPVVIEPRMEETGGEPIWGDVDSVANFGTTWAMPPLEELPQIEVEEGNTICLKHGKAISQKIFVYNIIGINIWSTKNANSNAMKNMVRSIRSTLHRADI